MRIRLGISQRLTLSWTLLFAIGLALFALLAASLVESAQQQALDDVLTARASDATATLQMTGKRDEPEALPENAVGFAMLSFRGLRLVSSNGTLPPSPVVRRIATLLPGAPQTIGDAVTYRVFVQAPTGPGIRIAAVAQESTLENVEGRVRRAFLLASLPILGFAGLAGWSLARRALSPIDRIVAAAESARSGDLSTRLDSATPDELGRLSRTFDRMLEQLEQSFARERSFIGDVSHELRQPLTAIAAETRLALTRERDPQAYRLALSSVSASTDRLRRTIDDLLLLARADAHAFDHRQRAELNEATSEACAELQRRESGPATELQLCDEPLFVDGSHELVMRLVENLVTNARKMARASVKVSVSASGKLATLAVEDDGPGIPLAERQQIFRRFHRSSTSYEGTGLGLPIAAAIARSCGGEIEVEDRPTGGARFIVGLPLRG